MTNVIIISCGGPLARQVTATYDGIDRYVEQRVGDDSREKTEPLETSSTFDPGQQSKNGIIGDLSHNSNRLWDHTGTCKSW